MTIGPQSAPAHGDGLYLGPVCGHPLYGRADLSGRVVTAFDPDGYVQVDGLLVRARLSGGKAGKANVGDLVDLELDPAGRLTAGASEIQHDPRRPQDSDDD